MFRRQTVRPSRGSARVRAVLLTITVAPLLLCCAATATAKRSQQPLPPTEVIELELRELGSSQRSHGFIVPLDGKISGAVTLFGEAGRCEVSSKPKPEERHELELRCSNPQLEFESTRVLMLDAPTIVGEFELNEARSFQIIVTRR